MFLRSKRAACIGLLVLCIVVLSACSPFYVARAAYEQSKILINRENISDAIFSNRYSEEEKAKLRLVLEARQFSKLLGLNPGQTFTKFYSMPGEAITYVVSAARKDAFELHQWWFPFVGKVPYKGYFAKEDALDEARDLNAKGYETWVRGAQAYSTLGWFNDPLLSPTLRQAPTQIVETIFHEILHTTIWIPNHVDFNESLANFVGHAAAIEFFEVKAFLASREGHADGLQLAQYATLARAEKDREFELAKTIDLLYEALSELYKSPLSLEAKLEQRQLIFSKISEPFKQRFPSSSGLLQEVNNAKILQLKLYLREIQQFERVFNLCDGNWLAFLEVLKDLKRGIQDDSSGDPFFLLAELKSCQTETDV